MKLNTVMIAVACVAAFAVAGCRYDKVADGEVTEGDLPGGVSDIASDVDVSDSSTEGNIEDIAGQKSFEELYTRCTDVEFQPVYFGLDSTVVSDSEIGKVDAVAQHLAGNANRVVIVEGHCDERGSNEYNMSLGESRATILRDYLVNSNISSDRIQTRSFGEERPAVLGTGESIWSKNRRGEFLIFQK